jgi:hypothetical protein
MQLRPGIYTMKSGDELGEAYAKAQWDTVTVQLQKAGVRLARLLNVALGRSVGLTELQQTARPTLHNP